MSALESGFQQSDGVPDGRCEGEELVEAGDLEHPEQPAVQARDHEPAVLCLGTLIRGDQDGHPGGIAIAEFGQVDDRRLLRGEGKIADGSRQLRGRVMIEFAGNGHHDGPRGIALQRAILGPSVLPEGFAVRYEPATPPLEVGGDWYDIVGLADGRIGIGIVVGDCVGRGLGAASVMGQLRSACRALLLQEASPSRVLTVLDEFAVSVPGAVCTTVFCGVLLLRSISPTAVTTVMPSGRRLAVRARGVVTGRGPGHPRLPCPAGEASRAYRAAISASDLPDGRRRHLHRERHLPPDRDPVVRPGQHG